MFYLVLKNTVANGKSVKAGDVIELGSDEAQVLLNMKRVEATSAPQPKKEKSFKKVTNRSIQELETPEDD